MAFYRNYTWTEAVKLSQENDIEFECFECHYRAPIEGHSESIYDAIECGSCHCQELRIIRLENAKA